MPFMRRQREAIALGGQQARRLQQLRLVSEKHIHEQHLLPENGGSPRSPTRSGAVIPPVFGHSTRASRTVEAIIESRTVDIETPSQAARLREKIRDARGGIQTERSAAERPRTTQVAVKSAVAASSTTSPRPATHAPPTHVFRQQIATVRRRGHAGASAASRRKLTRDEVEWIEKQLQFSQRVGLLEKECRAWWQSFYSSAGGGSASKGCEDGTTMTTLAIHKQAENGDQRRRQDALELQQQLNALRSQADDVMHRVHQMRDGTAFITDLQDEMDAFEQSLAQFRVAQREKFDVYVMEETLLGRDLTAFVAKMEGWEQLDVEKTTKSGSTTKRRGASKPAKSREDDDDMDFGARRLSASSDGGTGDNGGNEVDLVKRVRLLNNQILKSGGLKGGWDDREHAVFTSTLLKSGLTDEVLLANHIPNVGSNQAEREGRSEPEYETLVARFMAKCVKAVVTKTENAVRNHFDWYLGHLRLIQEKKGAIQRWKQCKESQRQQLIQQGLQEVEAEPADAVPSPGKRGAEQVDAQARAADTAKRRELETKEREQRARQLDAWREEKERRAIEKQEEEQEQRAQREAMEAKKRQELIEKKQQIMLYKLQKEQETAILRGRGKSAGPAPPGSQSPLGSNEELRERSRKAIEQAKTKRAQLQIMEERRQKQQELPDRPKSATRRKPSASASAASPTDTEGSPPSRDNTLLKPTKAFEARLQTKLELKGKEKERQRQGAHDAYFPGAGMISDVKIKSFGHIPIAPRAVPTWRRNV